MDIVISTLLSFSFVENKWFCKYVSVKPVTTKTLQKYMSARTTVVKERITSRLPDNFALVFDGLSLLDRHYLGFFATFEAEKSDCPLHVKDLTGKFPFDDAEK